MSRVKKDSIDLSTILVELKFRLSGDKHITSVHTTAEQACDFVDVMNQNRSKRLSRYEAEQFDNRLYHFDDYKKKATVSISLKDVKMMEIPHFMSMDDELEFRVLSF